MKQFNELNIKKIIQEISGYEKGTIVDFHTHPHSFDTKGEFSLDDILDHIDKINVDYICETDHNQYPIYNHERILKGCEVSTKKGHISLICEDSDLENFINKYIKDPKKKVETSLLFEYKKDNKNATIILPHAFQPGGYFYESESPKRVKFVAKKGVFLEWTNSRRSPDSKAAHKLNKTSYNFSIPTLGGSDAHELRTFGMAGIFLPKEINFKNYDLNKILGKEEWLIYHLAEDDETYNLYLLDKYANKYMRLCFKVKNRPNNQNRIE